MEKNFKLTKACCLSLSVGCIVFGLLDLIVKISFFATVMKLLLQTSEVSYKFLLVVGAIGICTCLFMIAGSILDNHWSMLPYLVWEVCLILIYIVIGIILLGRHFQGDSVNTVMIAVILGCIPIFSIHIWNVAYSRFLDIKEKRSASSEFVATE